MNREYHKWWSPCLQREMELLVFGHAGAKMLVFPTRDGRFYEYENLRMTEVLRDRIETGEIQLFCIDSVASESFYCFWAHPSGRIRRHIQYEDYVIREMLPFMNERNADPRVIAHGCSLGAFHAANIVFRHPELFTRLAAFSGRYDLTLSVECFQDLFDGYYSQEIYLHTPTHFLPNVRCRRRLAALRKLDIVLTIGREDPFLDNNVRLGEILASKGIPHVLHLWDERAHQGHYWRRMAALYV